MTRDPMLDCITRYSVRNDYLTSRAAVGDEPFKGSTDVVLFSDLPALLAAAREDERQRITSDFAEYLRHMEEWQAGYNKGHAAGVEQGQRDEREACIAAVRNTPTDPRWNILQIERAFLAAIDALGGQS